MATHLSFDIDRKADRKAEQESVPQPGRSAPSPIAIPANRNPRIAGREALPSQPARPGMRRVITRQQGCALEIIGHAVDYLNDCYLNQGPDNEILDFSGPTLEAAQILIAAQRQILFSLPLAESFSQRLRRVIFRRKPESNRRQQVKSSPVLPLSSSR